MLGTMLERVAAFAERQAGAVSLGQLTRAGLTERHARAWIRAERILPTAARAVFRMPGAEVTWRQDLWVAVLAGPPGTVVSHTSAAALRGLLSPPPAPHVTVPRGSSGRFAGAAIHHATVMSADRCRIERLPSTGLARAIVDCAALMDQEALDGAGRCRPGPEPDQLPTSPGGLGPGRSYPGGPSPGGRPRTVLGQRQVGE